MPVLKRGYGAIPSKPPPDAPLFSAAPDVIDALPSKFDLRDVVSFEVYDQGQLGSCVANAIAGAIEFSQRVQAFEKPFTPSRLFIYYETRKRDAEQPGAPPFNPAADRGCTIAQGVNVVSDLGAPPEVLWSYDQDFAEQPSVAAITDANKRKVLEWKQIAPNLDLLKASLFKGFPFLFGFDVPKAMESDQFDSDGALPMPTGFGDLVLLPGGARAGHAVLAIGYDDADDPGRFIARNSWGPNKGKSGYFTIPYDYVLSPNFGHGGFWTIRLVQ